MKINDITGGLKAYVAATKKETASEEEVLSRCNTCLKCPMRIKTRGISKVSQFLALLARQNNVNKDISEYSCGICMCSLLLLTNALPENLHKDTPEQAKKREKTNCWMK